MFGKIQAGSSDDSGTGFQLKFIISCKETSACKDALAVTDAAPITDSFTPSFVSVHSSSQVKEQKKTSIVKS